MTGKGGDGVFGPTAAGAVCEGRRSKGWKDSLAGGEEGSCGMELFEEERLLGWVSGVS